MPGSQPHPVTTRRPTHSPRVRFPLPFPRRLGPTPSSDLMCPLPWEGWCIGDGLVREKVDCGDGDQVGVWARLGGDEGGGKRAGS